MIRRVARGAIATRRWRWALVLAAGAVVLTARAAAAHAELISSSPAAGSIVRGPLTSVALTFSENVRAPAFVILTGPGDVRFDQGPPQILNATVTERLSSAAPDGKYTLAYRVVSADGHPVGDELTFTLAGTQQQAAGGTSSPPATASQGQDTNAAQRQDGIHWSHGLVGLLVVAAGAAALLYEFVRSRHQARR